MTKLTIKQFHKMYPDDDTCLQELFDIRYGSLESCPNPTCGKETKFYRRKDRKAFSCAYCGYLLYPLADTVFHKSSTPLRDWFFAMFLFTNSKNGVSAMELQRHLGVTYKTAWRMAKQIRQLFHQSGNLLKNIVEADETYIGGKRKGTRGRGAKGKTPVIGVAERGGQVRALVTTNTKMNTVMPFLSKHVETGSQVMTDDYNVYGRVSLQGFSHDTIRHGIEEYVRGNVHTNTIENFWSQLKRSINGTYHSISAKYLQSYVDEFAYRYNHRHLEGSLFPLLVSTAARLV